MKNKERSRLSRKSSKKDDVSINPLIKFHVQESLNTFTGDNTYPIGKWIEDTEEMSKVCGWSDIELFINNKRLLSRTAGLCNQRLVLNHGAHYEILYEFLSHLTSADVPGQLNASVKTDEETYQQYLFKMMEIVKQGDVSVDSLLDYVIAGIRDKEVNKSLLYGTATVSDFKG